MTRSFIDLLFILLCGTIVMLSQSLQVGQIEAAPARVGSGGVSEIRSDMVRLVTVDAETLHTIDEKTGQAITGTASDINATIDPANVILLACVNEDISHMRVMAAWSELSSLGRSVRLAASREKPTTNTEQKVQ